MLNLCKAMQTCSVECIDKMLHPNSIMALNTASYFRNMLATFLRAISRSANTFNAVYLYR